MAGETLQQQMQQRLDLGAGPDVARLLQQRVSSNLHEAHTTVNAVLGDVGKRAMAAAKAATAVTDQELRELTKSVEQGWMDRGRAGQVRARVLPERLAAVKEALEPYAAELTQHGKRFQALNRPQPLPPGPVFATGPMVAYLQSLAPGEALATIDRLIAYEAQNQQPGKVSETLQLLLPALKSMPMSAQFNKTPTGGEVSADLRYGIDQRIQQAEVLTSDWRGLAASVGQQRIEQLAYGLDTLANTFKDGGTPEKDVTWKSGGFVDFGGPAPIEQVLRLEGGVPA